MTGRWHVVDLGGNQHGGDHHSEDAALLALTDLVHELPWGVENPYLVEPATDAWAYAVPQPQPGQ